MAANAKTFARVVPVPHAPRATAPPVTPRNVLRRSKVNSQIFEINSLERLDSRGSRQRLVASITDCDGGEEGYKIKNCDD